MPTDCRYGFGTRIEIGFDDAISRIESLLKDHGFGVYSRINMKDVFGPEQDLPFRHYLIIGACRPDFAIHAFRADHNVGLLLPCNIVVYEELSGQVVVMVKDPVHMMDLLNVPDAIEAAIKVKAQLEELMAEL